MKTNNQTKATWIVGASSGIGESLISALQGADETIYISARNGKALNALALKSPAAVFPLPMDITDESAVNGAIEAISKKSQGLDRVIINAGTCEYIDSYSIDTEAVKRVMNTNFFGVISVINAVLPLLRMARSNDPNKSPQLVIMSSSVTYQALPRAGAYGASKAAIRYFTECLKLDLQHEGIDVRVVSPGFVKTPLTDKNDFSMPFMVSSDEAARRIVKGLNTKTFDINFPYRFTYLLKMMSWLPDSIRFSLAGKSSRHVRT